MLPAKKMRGSKIGAHIAVVRQAAPRRLIVGERIETVLSVYTAHRYAGRSLDGTAFWAAGDLGLDGRSQRVPGPHPDPDEKGLSIPDSVTELLLPGDGDSEKLLTQCAMQRAARRYARDGRTVRIVFAPAGLDFNDVLRGAA